MKQVIIFLNDGKTLSFCCVFMVNQISSYGVEIAYQSTNRGISKARFLNIAGWSESAQIKCNSKPINSNWE